MDCFVGMIGIFGFQWAPMNFAYCNGAHVTIQQNQMLFAVIGVTYGGDGVTYFQLPNLGGRKIIAQGQSTASGVIYSMGQADGTETVQLGQAQLPVHTHVSHFTPAGGGGATSVQVSTAGGTKTTPAAGDFLAAPNYGGDAVSAYVPPASAGTTVSLGGVSGSGGSAIVTVDTAGQGQSFSIMNPYLTLNICICTSGLWPQRP